MEQFDYVLLTMTLLGAVVFVALYFWLTSEVAFTVSYLVFFLLFALHYVHRTFVLPFRMSGRSRTGWCSR